MLPISVCGMAPVHPDAPDYEILQEYHSRRRHGVQPELLHPRVCQGLSDEICLQLDYEMKSNARNLQNIVETGGFLRVLVLLIKFTDHVDRETPPWENYDILFNDSGETPSITPTRSVAAFLDVNSYGKLQIEAEVIPWRLTDNTEEYYSFNQSGLSTEFIRCMYPILDELEAEGFNFSRFDLNQDGVIDSIGTCSIRIFASSNSVCNPRLTFPMTDFFLQNNSRFAFWLCCGDWGRRLLYERDNHKSDLVTYFGH